MSVKNIIFDLGGVLVDWNPEYVFLKEFQGDRIKMKWFFDNICTSTWNEEQDGGKLMKDATGDFNLMDDSKPIKKLQKSFNDVNIKMIRNNKLFGTFNDFVINSISEKRIDYIFQKNLILINSTHGHIKTNKGRWASDHHPVISVLKL